MKFDKLKQKKFYNFFFAENDYYLGGAKNLDVAAIAYNLGREGGR